MTITNVLDLPATSFSELVSGPVLHVYVGVDRRHWPIHHNLILFHSNGLYFDVLLNGERKRIEDAPIELPDEDPTVFELLVKWLYHGKIDDVSTIPADRKWEYAYTCQKLYLLSEKLGMLDLKNVAIDGFRKGCHETALVPGAEEMLPIYQHLPPASPFRKLVSHIAARQLMDPDEERSAAAYKSCFEACPDFAIDLIDTIRRTTGGFLLDDPSEGNPCKYHEHAGGETHRKKVTFQDIMYDCNA